MTFLNDLKARFIHKWVDLYDNVWRKPDGTLCNDNGDTYDFYWQKTVPNDSYDLAIALRVYPGTDKIHSSPVYPKDKLKLVEMCLKSLRNSIGKYKVKLWIILTDNSNGDFKKMIKQNWSKEDLVILDVGQCGGIKSLEIQLKVLANQTASCLVYAAEDDYFYAPRAIEILIKTLRSSPEEADFISLYNHPDNYIAELQQTDNSSLYSYPYNWISRAATTHTFATTRDNLIQCLGVFKKPFLSPIDADTSHWLAITQVGIFNPLTLFKVSKYWKFCWLFTWLFRFPHILLTSKYKLYIPTISLATHMANGLEGIGTNWDKLYDKYR